MPQRFLQPAIRELPDSLFQIRFNQIIDYSHGGTRISILHTGTQVTRYTRFRGRRFHVIMFSIQIHQFKITTSTHKIGLSPHKILFILLSNSIVNILHHVITDQDQPIGQLPRNIHVSIIAIGIQLQISLPSI